MFDRLFGRDKPQGTARDALRLLRRQGIEEGRELLRRLIKHEPSNVEALVLGIHDVTRPPEDFPEAQRRARTLERVAPGVGEIESLHVLATWTSPSDGTIESYNRMFDREPATIHGRAFRVQAAIALSDFEFQTACKPGHPVTGVFVTAAVKASAALVLRRHEEALEGFERGAREADQTPAFYQEKLKVKLLPEEAVRVVERYRLYCEAGAALARRDVGRTEEARSAFERLAALQSPLQPDLAALAREPDP